MSDDAPPATSTWRLARGRHRAAARLSIVLLALGCAATVVRALADTFAPLPAIGGLLDGVDRLLRMPVPPALAAFAVVTACGVRLHPALAPPYLAALTITPWYPGRRLPLGDVGLASTFVLLPALAVGLLWLLGQPSTLWIATGATLAYAAVAVTTALLTRHAILPLAIATLVVGLIPAAVAERTTPFAAVLLAILVVSGLAQRSIIAAAFGSDGVADVRRMVVQKRSTLGWFENLPLSRPPRRIGLEAFSSLALGGAVAMLGTAAEGWAAKPWTGLLTMACLVAGSIRVGMTFAVAPLSYGPIARVSHARWFAPRMDRLLVFPVLMLAWVSLTHLAVRAPRSEWNPIIGGACVAGAAMLCWWAAPRDLAWQTTGACRIVTAANKQQKLAEASLKRLTDPQSSRPR